MLVHDKSALKILMALAFSVGAFWYFHSDESPIFYANRPDTTAYEKWTEKEVASWVSSIGMGAHVSAFKKHHVHGKLLRAMDAEGLEAIGVPSHAASTVITERSKLESQPLMSRFFLTLCILGGCLFLVLSMCLWNPHMGMFLPTTLMFSGVVFVGELVFSKWFVLWLPLSMFSLLVAWSPM
jgi:hypothetical protein